METSTAGTTATVLIVWLSTSLHAGAQVMVRPEQLLPLPLPVVVRVECDRERNLKIDPELRAAIAADPVGELNRQFDAGHSGQGQTTARFLLEQAHCAAAETGAAAAVAFSYRTDHVWVTWAGKDPFGAASIRRILVHHPVPAPYTLDLPGVPAFYEVFMSTTDRATLTTVLTSTEKADETLDQIPAVVAKVIPAFFGISSATMATPGVRISTVVKAAEPVPFWVMPSKVRLPAKRAALTAQSVVAQLLSPDEFKEAAEALATRVGFEASQCVNALAVRQAEAIDVVRRSPACQPGVDEAAQKKICLRAFDTALRNGFSMQASEPGCGTDAEKKAMIPIDGAFRSLVMNGLASEVKGNLTFTNTPLQRVSFGLVEAIALRPTLRDPRVKLADGTIVADPLPRLLTIVTVNSSFQGYDRSSVGITRQEQWRWFGGAVVAPDFGLAAGLSWLPVRGVSVNAGGAWLFMKSADEGGIGKAPENPNDAFELGHARMFFVGVGYNFK